MNHVETSFNDSITDTKGQVILPNGEWQYDTKWYLRVNDIAGSTPHVTNSVTKLERDFIRSNFPILEANDNSKLELRRKNWEGWLPFTRNKSTFQISHTSDPIPFPSSNPLWGNPKIGEVNDFLHLKTGWESWLLPESNSSYAWRLDSKWNSHNTIDLREKIIPE